MGFRISPPLLLPGLTAWPKPGAAGVVRACAMAGALCWLGGCAVAPLPALDQATPTAWQHEAGAQGAPAPDLRGWWKVFKDPQLDRLVERALADNLSIRQATLRIQAARALAGSANAGFLPQLSAHTFSEPAPDSSASYFQMGFDAKWELGLFGRSQSQARVTAADLGMAESDAQAARVSVVAEVVRCYIELRAAYLRRALLGQIDASANEKSELIATRVRLRLASERDLAQAQAEAAGTEAAMIEPQLAIDNARQRMAVLLARSEVEPERVAGDLPTLHDLRVEAVPADLLRTRPEIRRAESEVLKAAGERGLARADLFPRLGLGGALSYASKVIGHTRLSDADGIVTFGPAIEIPLFDWGARRAVVTARDAELSSSLLAYRQAVLEGVAEAQTALATLARNRERLDVLERARQNLDHSDAAYKTLRRLGLADGLDRVASNNAQQRLQLETAQAQQDCSIAFVAFYKAMGGAPLPPAVTAQQDRDAAVETRR